MGGGGGCVGGRGSGGGGGRWRWWMVLAAAVVVVVVFFLLPLPLMLAGTSAACDCSEDASDPQATTATAFSYKSGMCSPSSQTCNVLAFRAA